MGYGGIGPRSLRGQRLRFPQWYSRRMTRDIQCTIRNATTALATTMNDPLRQPISHCPRVIHRGAPSATRHSRKVLSMLPVTSVVPSGEKATDRTDPECPVICIGPAELPRSAIPVILRKRVPWFTCQSPIEWSPLPPPEANVAPSGENATDFTAVTEASQLRSKMPSGTRHNRTVLSCAPPPDANRWPSGEKATDAT